jgi:hypothetical protein
MYHHPATAHSSLFGFPYVKLHCCPITARSHFSFFVSPHNSDRQHFGKTLRTFSDIDGCRLWQGTALTLIPCKLDFFFCPPPNPAILDFFVKPHGGLSNTPRFPFRLNPTTRTRDFGDGTLEVISPNSSQFHTWWIIEHPPDFLFVFAPQPGPATLMTAHPTPRKNAILQVNFQLHCTPRSQKFFPSAP